MSVHVMNKSPIIEAGFLQPLTALLSFNDREVQYHAIATLGNLALGSQKNHLTIFRTGVVHSIKELVLEASESVQGEMARCVACLASNGVYPPLDRPSYLVSFSQDELKGQLLKMGICEVLIPLTNSLSPDVQDPGSHALRSLSSRGNRTASDDYSAFNKVWDEPEGGMHNYLYRFLTSPNGDRRRVAFWTIIDLLESGDHQLIGNIHSSPLLPHHIRKLTALDNSAHPPSVGVPRYGYSGQEMDEILGLPGEIQLLFKGVLGFIDIGGDAGLSTAVGSAEKGPDVFPPYPQSSA